MIIAVTRAGRPIVLPGPGSVLRSGDILLAQGRFDRFEQLRSWSTLTIEREAPILYERLLANVQLSELVVAATLMIITGCLSIEQAHRAIDWRAIFLIAGMLPLGAAMQQSGAAAYAANGVVHLFGS